jgi:hypothetical protein
MANIIQTYFNIYFTEIIVGVLLISIVIVIISILYVIFGSKDDEVMKKLIVKNKKITKNIKKTKYTKQFLKGVDGIDLDLKVNDKNIIKLKAINNRP